MIKRHCKGRTVVEYGNRYFLQCFLSCLDIDNK